jgi:hypothetical protein
MSLWDETPTSPTGFRATYATRLGRGLVLFAVVAGMSILSCRDDDSTAGPCVHNYLDAVVHLASVRNHATQAPLDTVFMSAAAVDDHLYLLTALVQEANASGVTLVGDSLRCVLPCSFGHEEGHWAVTLSARGFARQEVEFDADYAVFHGGCPSWNDSGTVVDLEIGR